MDKEYDIVFIKQLYKMCRVYKTGKNSTYKSI